jgi:hypothetical protein
LRGGEARLESLHARLLSRRLARLQAGARQWLLRGCLLWSARLRRHD